MEVISQKDQVEGERFVSVATHCRRVGRGEAHGKVILMGEHSVVYGHPALALPFLTTTIKATVTADERPTVSLESYFYQGDINRAPSLNDPLICAIRESLSYMERPASYLKITIDSDLPARRGMGSSAAVAVAVIRALFDYHQIDLADQVLLDLANKAEVIAHGKPSGIDALTTSFKQPFWFEKREQISPFPINLDAYLIVADTGLLGKTKDAVCHIAKQYQDKPQPTKDLLNQLGQYALNSREAITDNDVKYLGRLMTKAHRNLSQLGVSHQQLDHLVENALFAGALGAKMTGGGLGGCMICLAETLSEAQVIAEHLEEEGAIQTWIHPMKGYQV